MDAIAYLLQEHSKFRKTLVAISKVPHEKARRLKFEVFCADLLRHEIMEEKIWYPVLRKQVELREIIKHLISEEKSAANAIKKLKKTKIDIIWKLKFYKLQYDINHHAKEEEKELFPKVKSLLTKAELQRLGTEMKKFKNRLNKEGAKGAI